MEIGSKIAKVRKEMNLTQEQLAERMQVTRQTVSRWESQTVYPEMEKIVSLAEILGVSCDYLLNDAIEEASAKTSVGKACVNPVTRLLAQAKGKVVTISFFDDDMDFDVSRRKGKIIEFDGSWAYVAYKKGKKTETKLVPLRSIASIKFEREDENWNF